MIERGAHDLRCVAPSLLRVRHLGVHHPHHVAGEIVVGAHEAARDIRFEAMRRVVVADDEFFGHAMQAYSIVSFCSVTTFL